MTLVGFRNDCTAKSLIVWMIFLCMVPDLCGAQNENSIAPDTGKTIELFLPYEKEQYYFSRSKEIGLDVTSLLAQLTPFNTVKAPQNQIGLKTKWYGRKVAFRINLGFDLEDVDQDFSFVYFSAGYERRKILNRRFAYTSGWEAIFKIEGIDGEMFFGAGNFHGIDYNINNSIFLGIEAQLRLLISDAGDPSFKLLPPTAVYLNVRF